MNDAQQYEAVFTHAFIGILVVDENAFIQSVNPFAISLFGYSKEEMIGKAIELLVPKRFHHTHVHHRNEYIHSTKNRPMGIGADLIAVKKDGTEIPVEISLAHYKNNSGNNIIVFISNITVRKNAEAELFSLKNQLEQTVEQRTHELTQALSLLKKSRDDLSGLLEKEKELSELKSRFVSMASHEFRTPLSTILTSAYLVDKYRSVEDQPNRSKHVQRIISSVSMLTDTLNDFLSVGRLEEGKIQVHKVEMNIKELLEEMLEEMKTILKRGQTIRNTHEGQLIAMMDPSLLKHIVMNLVSNAVKFSSEDTVISVTTSQTESGLLLSVKDEGIGISEQDQEHLMERFFRGTNAGNIQGTGLGLHIVSKYAELMNGTVSCKSELNKGSEFSVKFSINTSSS